MASAFHPAPDDGARAVTTYVAAFGFTPSIRVHRTPPRCVIRICISHDGKIRLSMCYGILIEYTSRLRFFFIFEYQRTARRDQPGGSDEHLLVRTHEARAAVRRVLIDPDSAQFNALRSVEADAAKYVCGAVKARDKDGKFADVAFAYAVSLDFAYIDDEGRVTHQGSAFRPRPATAEEKAAKPDLAISPGAMSMVKAVQKIAPKADPSTLSTLATLVPSAGSTSPGDTMEQQIGQLAGRAAMAADQVTGHQLHSTVQAGPSKAEAGHGNAVDWQGHHPPVAWPTFPPDHPLAKPTRKRTTSEALALANDVEDRWQRSETVKDATKRPSPEEIQEACRALLTIDSLDTEYRKAWAAFVRLQGMHRQMAAN